MAYAKINSVTNANMAKVNSAAKAALGKIGSIDAPSTGLINTYSIAFDAADDFMVSGGNVTYDEGSFITWVKCTGTSGQILWHVSGYYYLYRYSGDELRFRHGMTGSTNVTVDINDGNWHCIVGTAEGGSGESSTVKGYVDGSLVVEETETNTYTVPDDVITFGAWPGSGASMLNGSLDEVGFWSSVLTAAEVTALYNSGTPIDLKTNAGDYASSANLLNWWRMGDGDTYPTIQDNQGSNDLTMTNMAAEDIESDVPSA